MKITERENLLLRRALDKATTPNEAEIAAKAFIASLRNRGINGYHFVPAPGQTRPEPEPQRATSKPEPKPESKPEPKQSNNAEDFKRWRESYREFERAKTDASARKAAREAAEAQAREYRPQQRTQPTRKDSGRRLRQSNNRAGVLADNSQLLPSIQNDSDSIIFNS